MTPRVKQYTRKAAKIAGVRPETVWDRTRDNSRVYARSLVWHALRLDGFTYPQIARFTGRHHTTVMHGIGELPSKLNRNAS